MTRKNKTIEALKLYIGRRIRLARRGKEMSQTELAKRTHLTTNTISNIEKGLVIPRIENLVSIKQELDIEELFV